MSEKIEKFLPHHRRFDTVMQEVGDLIDGNIKDIQSEWGGDILEPGKEIDQGILYIWQLSEHLAREVANPSHEDVAQVTKAMYRAAIFALQTIDDIKDAPIGAIDLGGYVGQNGWNEERMREDISKYLLGSPALNAHIVKYMPEIDETGRYNHHAELMAGLLFMLAERRVCGGLHDK